MNFSVEAECGYITTNSRVEGTSVEYVLARPGGKLIDVRPYCAE